MKELHRLHPELDRLTNERLQGRAAGWALVARYSPRELHRDGYLPG